MDCIAAENERIQRVRAIVLTERDTILFIKRVKPDRDPYFVAPGGGVEADDPGILAALHRELREELGARVDVLDTAFVLEHHKADKDLQEYFFICRLIDYDLTRRYGPEFDDPARGQYIPYEVPLAATAIANLNIQTPELRDWLLDSLSLLQSYHAN